MGQQKRKFFRYGGFWRYLGNNNNAPTFSEHLADNQKLNRLYCLVAAKIAGLTNYLYEFWHFPSGDRYDIYWKNKDHPEKKALYGPIQ